MRVLVVWEPVIPTDVAPPSSKTLARLSDPRAVQYWDPERSLSAALVRAALADPAGAAAREGIEPDSIVWDCVAKYPPGAKWRDDAPLPADHGCPVVAVMDRVESWLE